MDSSKNKNYYIDKNDVSSYTAFQGDLFWKKRLEILDVESSVYVFSKSTYGGRWLITKKETPVTYTKPVVMPVNFHPSTIPGVEMLSKQTFEQTMDVFLEDQKTRDTVDAQHPQLKNKPKGGPMYDTNF